MFVVISNNAVNITDRLDSLMSGADHITLELREGDSTLALRYALVNGKIVDKFEGKTDEQVLAQIKSDAEAAQAEVVATPVAKAPITKLEFMNRFTMDELAGIYTAAKTEVMIEVFLDKLKLATEINLSDANTIAGVNSLTTAGLLTADRAKEILA
jgi:hypothetical protein